MTRRALTLAAALCAGGLAASCGGSTTAASGGAERIAVTASDSRCEVERTELNSGAITFAVANKGSDVTEVYVYGDGDKVMGERENIGPATSAEFTVELGSGTYQVACKPGQTGSGIRTKIEVHGTASTKKVADRTVEMKAHDLKFEGLDGFRAKVGETVKFELDNTDKFEQHEFELFGPGGEELGEIAELAPGKTGEMTVTFEKAGTYTYKCTYHDHDKAGMAGSFIVS